MEHKIATALAFVTLACGQEVPPPGETARQADVQVADDRPAIVFLGTSLTAGLGVEPEEAYPALIRDTVQALGFDLKVVNAGVSGETSAGGLQRIGWVLQNPVAVMVLELGANDGLRGLSVPAMQENIQAIVDSTVARYPEVAIVIVGMEAPPNMGSDYTEAFGAVFASVARANNAVLVPFLLEGVGGLPELNQDDEIHPNPEGHKILATNVWKVLGPVLRARFEH